MSPAESASPKLHPNSIEIIWGTRDVTDEYWTELKIHLPPIDNVYIFVAHNTNTVNTFMWTVQSELVSAPSVEVQD